MRAIDETELGLVSGGVASPYLNLMHPVNGGAAGVINPGGVMHVAGVSGSTFYGRDLPFLIADRPVALATSKLV